MKTEFKVGDKVIVTEDNEAFKGEIGIITELSRDQEPAYAVIEIYTRPEDELKLLKLLILLTTLAQLPAILKEQAE